MRDDLLKITDFPFQTVSLSQKCVNSIKSHRQRKSATKRCAKNRNHFVQLEKSDDSFPSPMAAAADAKNGKKIHASFD